jgi:hypothetical protein
MADEVKASDPRQVGMPSSRQANAPAPVHSAQRLAPLLESALEQSKRLRSHPVESFEFGGRHRRPLMEPGIARRGECTECGSGDAFREVAVRRERHALMVVP